MVDIVAVHGIGQTQTCRVFLQRAWSDAIWEGMINRATTRSAVSVELAFFGDFYATGKADGVGPLVVADLEPGIEQELLLALAFGEEPPTPANLAVAPKALGLHTLQAALRKLQQHELLDGVAALILRTVRQVARYFTDAAFRNLVQEEMSRAMSTCPTVVVAHSLGSVIAYDWLRSNNTAAPVTFLTLGCPLGFRVIREHLDVGTGLLPWPEGVTTWVNAADTNDVVALVKELDTLVDGQVEDRTTHVPVLRTHSAVEYLRNAHTGRALVRALG